MYFIIVLSTAAFLIIKWRMKLAEKEAYLHRLLSEKKRIGDWIAKYEDALDTNTYSEKDIKYINGTLPGLRKELADIEEKIANFK